MAQPHRVMALFAASGSSPQDRVERVSDCFVTGPDGVFDLGIDAGVGRGRQEKPAFDSQIRPTRGKQLFVGCYRGLRNESPRRFTKAFLLITKPPSDNRLAATVDRPSQCHGGPRTHTGEAVDARRATRARTNHELERSTDTVAAFARDVTAGSAYTIGLSLTPPQLGPQLSFVAAPLRRAGTTSGLLIGRRPPRHGIGRSRPARGAATRGGCAHASRDRARAEPGCRSGVWPVLLRT